jgi:hypothetical protein
LLTGLGSEIRKNLAPGVTLETLAPDRLQRFIKYELAKDISIIEPNPPNGTLGIIPATVSITDPNLFFRPATHSTSQPITARTDARYHSGFWVAFKNPLDLNLRRYLIEQFRHFVDLPLTAPAPPNSFELDRSYVVGIEGALPPSDAIRVHNAITRFLSDHSLNPALVYREAVSLLPHQSQTGSLTTDSGEIVELARGLHQLGFSDLSRISIPIDIDLQILRKSK